MGCLPVSSNVASKSTSGPHDNSGCSRGHLKYNRLLSNWVNIWNSCKPLTCPLILTHTVGKSRMDVEITFSCWWKTAHRLSNIYLSCRLAGVQNTLTESIRLLFLSEKSRSASTDQILTALLQSCWPAAQHWDEMSGAVANSWVNSADHGPLWQSRRSPKKKKKTLTGLALPHPLGLCFSIYSPALSETIVVCPGRRIPLNTLGLHFFTRLSMHRPRHSKHRLLWSKPGMRSAQRESLYKHLSLRWSSSTGISKSG